MVRRSPDTRERILGEGLALVSRAGLSGLTIGALASQVRMSKSGLFAHFKSKDEMQIELLEHTAQYLRSHIIAPALEQPEGLQRLRALITQWFGWAPRSGLPGGCPVAAGMFEFDDIESPVRDKIIALDAEWRTLLCGTVRRAAQLEHLRKDLDVEQFVWELGGIYLAHHVSQRFLRSPEAGRRAAAAVETLIGRATAGASHKATRKARKVQVHRTRNEDGASWSKAKEGQ